MGRTATHSNTIQRCARRRRERSCCHHVQLRRERWAAGVSLATAEGEYTVRCVVRQYTHAVALHVAWHTVKAGGWFVLTGSFEGRFLLSLPLVCCQQLMQGHPHTRRHIQKRPRPGVVYWQVEPIACLACNAHIGRWALLRKYCAPRRVGLGFLVSACQWSTPAVTARQQFGLHLHSLTTRPASYTSSTMLPRRGTSALHHRCFVVQKYSQPGYTLKHTEACNSPC